MRIEKVSRFIQVNPANSTIAGGAAARSVLLSLPRVRWLEDPANDSIPQHLEKPVQYKPPKPAHPIYASRRLFSRERQAYNLSKDGYTTQQICGAMGISGSAARSYVASAKKKIAAGQK